MLSLDDIRKRYPNAQGYSDGELIDYISSTTGIDPNEVSKRVGFRQANGSDAWNSLKIGAQKLPSAVAGIGDIASGLSGNGRVFSKLADTLAQDTGFSPSAMAEENERRFSDQYYANQAELEQARRSGGLLDEASVFARNPSMILNSALRSAPGMVAGGLGGLALRGAVGAVAGAGIGEGAITAGSTMDSLRGVDAERAAMSSLGAGVGTGLLSAGGARVAKALGIGDIDLLTAGTGSRGLAKRVGLGAAQESLEEAPQSAQEQAWQNYANRDPLTKGVGSAALEGGIVGGFVGGGFNALSGRRQEPLSDKDPSNLLDTANTNPPAQFDPAQPRGTTADMFGGGFRYAEDNTRPEFDLQTQDYRDNLQAPNAQQMEIQFPEPLAIQPEQGSLFADPEPVTYDTKFASRNFGLVDPVEQAPEQAGFAFEQPAPVVPQTEQPLTYQTPQGEAIPTPEDAGFKGKAQVTLYNELARAAQDGLVTPAEVIELSADIAQSKLATAKSRIGTAISDAKARAALQNATPEQARAQLRVEAGDFMSKKEAIWFNARTDFANEGKSDAELARELGIKNVQSVTGYVKKNRERVIKGLAARYKVEPADIEALMFKRTAQANEVADPRGLPPSQQQSVIDNDELFGGEAAVQGMSQIDSVGESKTAIGETVPNPDINKPDPVAIARAEQATTEREQLLNFVLAETEWGALAIEDWNDMKSDDMPPATELSKEFAGQWAITYGAWKNGYYTTEELESEQREIEDGIRESLGAVPQDNAGSIEYTTEPSGQSTTAGLPSPVVENTSQNSEELESLTKSQAKDEKLAKQNSKESEETTEETDEPAAPASEDKLAALQAKMASRPKAKPAEPTPEVSVDPVKLLTDLQAIEKYNKAKRAQAKDYLQQLRNGEDVGAEAAAWVDAISERKSESSAKSGTTPEAITTALKQVTAKTYNPRIKILKTAAEAVEQKLLSSTDAGSTQAFVTASGNAYFIAENIPAGKEMAVFLHEVGAHLGIEGLLTDKEYNALVNRIFEWATSGKDTQEAKIALAAMNRIEKARVQDEDAKAELIAYFVEEAVNAGVNPTALKYNSEIGRWFNMLLNALKKALATLGIEPNRLNAQQIVDLAYGAANLELGLDEFTKPNKTLQSKTVDTLPEPLQEPVRTVADILKDKGTSAINLLAMTNTLVDSAAKRGLKSAKKWATLLSEQQAIRNERERDIDIILTKADKLSVKQQEDVWKTARDMSLSGKWGYKPTWRDGVVVDPKQAEAYNALSKEQREVLDDIFKHGNDTLKKTQSLLDATIDAEFDAKLKKSPDKYQDIQKERDKYKKMYGRTLAQLQGPYVPLQGVGSHIVVAKSAKYKLAEASGADLTELRKNPDDYVVVFTNSQAEAEAERRKILKESKVPMAEVTAKPKREWIAQNDSIPFEAFQKLRNLAQVSEGKMSETLNNMITELYITSLAETSSRKAELRREGVIKMNPEAIRQAFVTRGRGNAHYISVLEKGGEIADAFVDMNKEAGDNPDGEVTKLANEFAKRYANSTKFEPSPIIDALKSGNSVWMLLTKPAYYLNNATQPFVMGLPMLAAKFDYDKSASALSKAYGELLKKSVDFKNMDSLPKDVREAMKTLQKLGKLDFGLSQDLGSLSAMGGSKATRGIQRIERALRHAAQKSEALNRLSIGMTAYRLAKESGMSEQKAVDYAVQVIDESQGDYSSINAPRLFNGSPIATLLTQFRKFQVIQATYIIKNFWNSFGSGTKEEKAIARRTLAFVMGHYGVLAGALGLPLMNVIKFVYNSMDGDDDDEKQDFETDLRKALGNGMMADLLTRGAPAGVLGVDTSDTLGAGNAFAILPYSDIDFSTRDGVNAVAAGLIGPTVSHAYAVQSSLQAMGNGEYYKGLEALLPSGPRMASKALREQLQGVENSKGDTLITPEEVELFNTTVKVLGFRTQDDTMRQLVRNQQYEFDQFFKQRTSNIKRQYTEAMQDGDTEEVADANRRWAELQEFKTSMGFKATPRSELIRSRAKAKDREDDTIDGVQFTDRNEDFTRAMLSDE